MPMQQQVISNKAGKRVRWTRKKFPERGAAFGAAFNATAFVERREPGVARTALVFMAGNAVRGVHFASEIRNLFGDEPCLATSRISEG